MALNTGKKITRRSWDVIPMPDMVIERVNVLGSDQPEQFVFTDCKGHPIGDVEIPGVDTEDNNGVDDALIPGVEAQDLQIPVVEDDVELPGVELNESENSPIVAIDDDLDVGQPDPAPIAADPEPNEVVVETVEDDPMPDPVQNDPAPAPEPQVQGPRRSAQARMAPQSYTPSMTGSRYAYAAAQLEYQGVLHPDAHMFVQDDFYQAEPDAVAAIMMQLSLKAGLKKWGDKAFKAAHAEMKQLHLRDTFKPMHLHELTHLQ